MQKFIAVFFLFVLPFSGWSQCPPAQSPGFHVVQKGETLYYLSRLYNVTVDQLCQWNNIQKSDVIKLCTQLKVRAEVAPSNAAVASSTALGIPQQGNVHLVTQGESVAGLAALYGYTEQRFRKFNNLKPGEAVAPGRVLYSNDCQCPDPNAGSQSIVTGYDAAQPAIENNRNADASQKEDPFGQAASTPQNTEKQALTDQVTTAETEADLLRKFGASGPAQDLPAKNTSGRVSPPKTVAPFMSAAEVEMVDEINLVRFDPPAYVPYIEAYMEKIKRGQVSGSVETCEELIAELKRTASMATLEPMECIYRAAKLHGQEQAPKGTIDHVGKNGSYPWDRVREACPSLTDGNENLVGGASDVRESVILLLVDHGISNRGHRRTILDPEWRFVGCYNAGKVGRYANYWIQNFGK